MHIEQLVHELDTFTNRQHAARQLVRALIWWLYADLEAYTLLADTEFEPYWWLVKIGEDGLAYQ